MMKINILSFFIIWMGFTSCYDAPEYPNTPNITFEDIIFKEIGTNTDPDSLIMTISFEDGDGDLGINDRFTDPKFRKGDFYIDTSTGNLLTLQYVGLEGYEELPAYEFPYSCEHWIEQSTFNNFCSLAGITSDCDARIEEFGLTTLVTDKTKLILDTLYFEPNPNRSNYFLTFLEETSPGTFEEFDWLNANIEDPCAINFSLTFPPISDDTKSFVSEGTIRFSLTVNRIPAVFGDKRLKVRIKIKDRAHHESNEVESDSFTIQEIKVN
ncbi:MAG: hypothetical protein WD555_06485 [Fulvivirga sp.]